MFTTDKRTKKLLILNGIVWGILLFILAGTFYFRHSFLKRNEQLVQEFTEYQDYNTYAKRKEYLLTKMTPSVVAKVCPIIQVDKEDKEPKIKVTKLRTEHSMFQDKLITIVVSFKLGLSDSKVERDIQMQQIYSKQNGRWMMVNYNYV